LSILSDRFMRQKIVATNLKMNMTLLFFYLRLVIRVP
jgi:hypothetical protein